MHRRVPNSYHPPAASAGGSLGGAEPQRLGAPCTRLSHSRVEPQRRRHVRLRWLHQQRPGAESLERGERAEFRRPRPFFRSGERPAPLRPAGAVVDQEKTPGQQETSEALTQRERLRELTLASDSRSNRPNGARTGSLFRAVALQADRWEELSPSGSAPSARNYPTAVWSPSDDAMYVFGGSTSSGPGLRAWRGESVLGSGAHAVFSGRLNDLHRYDRQARSSIKKTRRRVARKHHLPRV